MPKPLLDQIKGQIKEVKGDGGYDGAPSREAINKKGAKSLAPPRRDAIYKGTQGDRAILEIIGLGNDEEARSLWGKLTGYSRRVLVESAFSRLKRLFGDRLFSRSLIKQSIENQVRCLLINQAIRI